LHHPDAWDIDGWDLEHVQNKQLKTEYIHIVGQLQKAVGFMRTVGADDSNSLKTVDLFMSHEGLLLDYETCLTRSVENNYFNLGTHFLWIGDRTRQCTFLN
jgi:3-deoxy-7-phosphoheptulonate synthase